MKSGTVRITITCLIVISVVLASCSSSTASTSTAPVLTTSTTPTTTKTTSPLTTASVFPTSTKLTTTSAIGNWWDSLGKPQYGGTMTIRLPSDIGNWEPDGPQALNIMAGWLEKLVQDDWTLNPTVFSYSIIFRPSDYVKGGLAESWEFTDPGTIVFHLRKGIHWQNIPPVNGRELTSDDIVFHFDRQYGLGGGYTVSNPLIVLGSKFKDLTSLTAPDKYTVVFKWKTPNPENIMEIVLANPNELCIEAPEAVKQWGNLMDWHHAIGTGPFMVKDYVSGSSATLVKNPNYWGYDERYPQNQLPYIDTLKVLIIPDDATALAGLRTGKIDVLDSCTMQQAQQMAKTNPEILQTTAVSRNGVTISLKNDIAPFNDIRVRKAMQIAIDLNSISSSYYSGTVVPYPSSMTTRYMKGWGIPYEQWPQDLKDQYAYNPTAAKQLLAAAGYPTGFKTDVVADNSGDMDLLQIVQSYLAAVGINMEIRPMDAVTWNTFVRVQRKYDQMSYRANGALGLIFEPMTQLTQFQTGNASNYFGISDPVFDTYYPKALASTNIDDIKKVVVDANLEVAQQHFFISLLQPTAFGLCQPWLKGFSYQVGAIGGSSGPFFLNFYAARYWIDGNIKKSMGYKNQ